MSGPLALLGHQRPRPRVAEALAHYGCRGRVAVISAGWRHDEPELDALERDLGRRLVHLPLYRWFDEITLGNTARQGMAYSGFCHINFAPSNILPRRRGDAEKNKQQTKLVPQAT